jgi:hypothetical protein
VRPHVAGISIGMIDGVPSSSRTDSPMVTEVSWFEYCRTIILVSSMPRLVDSSPVISSSH